MKNEELVEKVKDLSNEEYKKVDSYIDGIISTRTNDIENVRKAYNRVISFCLFMVPVADTLGDYVRLSLRPYDDTESFVSQFQRRVNDLTMYIGNINVDDKKCVEYKKECDAVMAFLTAINELGDELSDLLLQSVKNGDIVQYFIKVMKAGNESGCTKLFGYGIEV